MKYFGNRAKGEYFIFDAAFSVAIISILFMFFSIGLCELEYWVAVKERAHVLENYIVKESCKVADFL